MRTSTVFRKIVGDCLYAGSVVSPRGIKCAERIGYRFEIEDPTNLAFDLPGRKFNWKYLAAELLWYLSGDRFTKDIGKFAKLWLTISNENGEVNSNYGNLVLKKKVNGITGYEFALNSLVKDQFTRQSIIRYNSDEHQYEGNKDFPCTLSNQFFIRNNKMSLLVNMRSNDMFYGFQYDLAWFGLLLQSMLLSYEEKDVYSENDKNLGKIIWNAGSAHIYENMWDQSKKSFEKQETEAWDGCEDYFLELQKPFPELEKNVSENIETYWQLLQEEYCGKEKEFIQKFLSIKISGKPVRESIL